jgi:hypothetical protein
MISPRQGLVLVVGIFAIAATLSTLQRRSARMITAQTQAANAALDSLAAEAQARADELDARLGADPDASLQRSFLAAPVFDVATVQFTLEARRAGTYIDDVLASHGGANYRWPDRLGDPMRVWVQPSPLPGFDPAFVQMVRDGFGAWDNLGLPFLFTFITDSARAEIIVTWVDRYDAMVSGRTLWQHDQHGWIVGGSIELALHQPSGRALDAPGIAAIARHEAGHLIGLDHTSDATSVMAARVQVTELSEADRRTARLVYDLPPGRLPR